MSPSLNAESAQMHADHHMNNMLNMYYVDDSNGDSGAGYCMVMCPASNQTLNNIWIVMCKNTRGNPPYACQVMPHESGHGLCRFFDEYLLDSNGDGYIDTTCAAVDTWCAPDLLFCDDNSAFPQPSDPQIPKQLMWYTYMAPHLGLCHHRSPGKLARRLDSRSRGKLSLPVIYDLFYKKWSQLPGTTRFRL